MKNQITRHTTQDRSGEDLFTITNLCELTVQFVHRNKHDQSQPELRNYINTMAVNADLSPDRIIHPSGRTARDERLLTIDAFCTALDRCRKYVVDSNEVFLYLNSIYLEPDGSTFIHQPSHTTVTPIYNGPEPEVQNTSWSEGEPQEKAPPKSFFKSRLLQEAIFDIAVEAGTKMEVAGDADTDESIANAIMAEVFSFIQSNMEVK